jgi:hypothetical protein
MTLGATVELTWGIDDPFMSGAPASSEAVFAQFDCAVNGVGFMIDWNDDQLQGPNTIPLYRYGGQLDAGIRPGEASLSREDLWRRTISSLHHGTGQRWADRKDSDEFRFRSSKGIDCWTRDRVTLLRDVTQPLTSATVTEMVAVSLVGTRAYLNYNDNGTWKVAAVDPSDALNGGLSGSTGITLGNASANADAPQLASSGSDVYAINNAGAQIMKSVGGITAPAALGSIGSGIAYSIGWAHGHLLVGGGAGGRVLFDMTSGTSVSVTTLADLNTYWLCFAEGQTVIYAAAVGTNTVTSKIYRITYDPAAATLGAPTLAAPPLPVGEQIRTIFGYLGFLFIGTSRGFRMASESSTGDLTIGPLIPITGGVKSFTALAQFVYFAWANFDATSAGIGRIDITTFTDAELVPAYASDLMAPVAGTVCGLVAADNANVTVNAPRVWFAATGTGGGIFVQHATDFVASGTLDTGLVGYDLSEQKDLSALDLRTEPLAGTIEVQVSGDEGTFNSIDIQSTAGSAGMYMPTRHIGASRHELRLVFTRGSTTTAPVMSSVTMLAYPAVQRGEVWTLPFIIQDDVVDNLGYPQHVEFWTQVFFIRNLAIPGTAPVTVQFGSESFQAHIADYQTSPIKLNEYGRPQATMRVQFKNMDRQVAA